MANILEEVQQYVAAKLSSDTSLSDCTFLVENIKDIDYQIKNALGRQGIVGIVMTPRATYAGKYEDLFLSWTLEELEIDIVENPIVNRGKRTSYITGQDAAMKVFDRLCPLSGDFEGQFNPVTYEEGEDSGLIVNRCILKALVYGEHGDTPQPEPGLNMQFVKLLDGPPSKPPHDGWMWPQDDRFVIWQNGQQHVLGNLTFNAMSAYVSQQLSGYLPAEIYGSHDEYATVKKIIEIHDERPDSYNEPVLTLAQNNSNRSFEIINTPSLATLNFGVLSSGVPKISFGIDDPESFNTVYFQNKSGTLAYQSDISTKADLSALDLKQDRLSDAQVSAINSVVDERKTVVTYTDNTSAEFDVVGELASGVFPDKSAVASVKIGTAVTSLGRQVFEQCENLSSVALPNSITSIGDYAFNACVNLTNVAIPDSVTSIGDVAFGACVALQTLTIPKSVQYIGARAFESTESLTRCVFEEKSAQEVQSMANYYWDVYSPSVIETWNAASQEWANGELSGKADANDLSDYLPISGGTMYGTIEFSPESDWQQDLGYKLVQLNQTGENWQMVFGVDDHYGQPYVAHNGSETGIGPYYQYSWKLWFPDENGTLATQEWTYGELSAYPQSNEISATRVETMTTIHESDWANISASASSSTLYIVIPD